MMTEMEINNNGINVNNKRPPSSNNKGSSNIFKVALHMLRKKKDGLKENSNNNNNKSVLPASTNAALSQIMGSVRPLYLQSDIGGMSPPLPQPLGQHDGPEASPGHPAYTCSSPSCSTISRCSSRSSSLGGGMSSMYASAQSLYDLDNHDDEAIHEGENNEMYDGDAYYDGLVGDDLIDAKAELFIANFYQQMRLQN